jgi:hypothetical protein
MESDWSLGGSFRGAPEYLDYEPDEEIYCEPVEVIRPSTVPTELFQKRNPTMPYDPEEEGTWGISVATSTPAEPRTRTRVQAPEAKRWVPHASGAVSESSTTTSEDSPRAMPNIRSLGPNATIRVQPDGRRITQMGTLNAGPAERHGLTTVGTRPQPVTAPPRNQNTGKEQDKASRTEEHPKEPAGKFNDAAIKSLNRGFHEKWITHAGTHFGELVNYITTQVHSVLIADETLLQPGLTWASVNLEYAAGIDEALWCGVDVDAKPTLPGVVVIRLKEFSPCTPLSNLGRKDLDENDRRKRIARLHRIKSVLQMIAAMRHFHQTPQQITLYAMMGRTDVLRHRIAAHETTVIRELIDETTTRLEEYRKTLGAEWGVWFGTGINDRRSPWYGTTNAIHMAIRRAAWKENRILGFDLEQAPTKYQTSRGGAVTWTNDVKAHRLDDLNKYFQRRHPYDYYTLTEPAGNHRGRGAMEHRPRPLFRKRRTPPPELPSMASKVVVPKRPRSVEKETETEEAGK